MKANRARNYVLAALCGLVIEPLCLAQSPVAGDWLGTLNAGGTRLHLGLHIAVAADKSLTATFDSIDQHANGIPVTTITFTGSKLKFTIDAAHVSYEGTINMNGTEIDGTFTQGADLALSFKRAPAQAEPNPATPSSALSSSIDGLWLGSIDTGAIKLRIAFKIANTSAGLTAQMQSPDQNPTWIPASSITQSGSTVSIALKPVGISYEGTVAADLSAIDGTFTQGGSPLPLKLARIKDEAALELRRPQNPVKPYPYREEDVAYTNKAAGNTIAGTLTLPDGKGPFPAVLLIVGSGPHDRDETLLGHKPFLVLSDYLTRKGIAVLRADKRGVGKSPGDLATATTADFASDAEAGVAYLKSRAEVDPHRIGLIGHSEGGIIAPMVAVHDQDVAFIVMMAGSGIPGDQIIVEQARLIAEAGGVSKEIVDKNAENEREVLSLVETEKDPATLERLLAVKLAAAGVPDAQIAAQTKAITSPWFRYFLTYDPAVTLRKLTIPVLAINGSLDLQVPPALNLPAIRKALEDAGNKHFEVDELPGLNHLFQTAKTGAPSEYGQIEETISPLALDKMANWILKQ
ncbi:MAG: alpha/beta fold hydrolase [Terracidiphilus sp.]